jgi:hypothetical protein
MPTVPSSASQQVVPSGGLRRLLGAATRFARTQGREPSTYRGLSLLASAIGIYLRPELIAAITAAGLGLSGLIAVLFPDAAPEVPATGSALPTGE